MLNWHSRTLWQSPAMPVVGPKATLSSVMRIAIHYTAAPKVPDDTASYLRAIQHDYTTNRGYSIGYNHAVDRSGRVWECRGLDIKCAANKGFNDTTIAILVLVDGNAPASDVMVDAVRSLVVHIRDAAPGATRIVGHQQIGATACPGAGLQAQVISGVFEPRYAPSFSPLLPVWVAATGGDMLRFVGDRDNPGPTRWLSNGQVRTTPTFEYATYLIRTKQIINTLETADMLSTAELDGLPLVGD